MVNVDQTRKTILTIVVILVIGIIAWELDKIEPLIFPVITTTVSLLFVLSVFEQYRRKHKTYQLMWTIAMFLFFLTAGAEAFALIINHWYATVYRIYYVLAAIQVTFMGGGVLYLFGNRNVINERNSAKALFLFSLMWAFFSFIFMNDSFLFDLVLIPSVIMLVLSIIYVVINQIDKIRFRDAPKITVCNICRTEQNMEHLNHNEEGQLVCEKCQGNWLNTVNQSSAYNRTWQKLLNGPRFANLFLIFTLFIFALMNILAWTSPLNYSILQTGKEVSGLPWQLTPNSPRAAVRLFSPLHTVPGGIALIGGGFYSYFAWQWSIRKTTGSFEWRKGFFNIYIAVGALVLGQGAFFSGFGLGTLYISETISTLLMYFGFLESDSISKEKLVDIFRIRSRIKGIITPS